MQSLEGPVYQRLEKIARDRGISIQVLIRAVIIPEWFRENGNSSENHQTSQHDPTNTISAGRTSVHQRGYSPIGRSHPLRNPDHEE
ncbi:MAG TPA: hypothetical protein VE177_00225 [Candidatus Binatus sp.]|nr:hypothetical protein [Candidatus Binatus sp.]